MALISSGAYETNVAVPRFLGLDQSGDGYGSDPRVCVECENAQTRGGYLRPMGKCEAVFDTLPAPIETLARLHRRWYTEDGHHEILIAACAGQLYWAFPDNGDWERIPLPVDWTGSSYQSNVWSCATYEINETAESDPIDVLLMSNALDGMICVRGDNLTASVIPTPRKFGVIARFNERIFGGAIPDDPDMLIYSAPYDPYNWEAREDIPEDGGGSVQQPSWDGDSFTALVPYGSYLLCVKKYRIWRLVGTDPGEYAFYEQYGGGTAYPNTIGVSSSVGVLMLGLDSVMRYNGESTTPFQKDAAQNVFYHVSAASRGESAGCIFRERYYLALPMTGHAHNSAVLIFDPHEGTWLYRSGVSVESWLPTDDTLYFTSHETPGVVYRWDEDAWQSGRPSEPVRWVGPWLDFSQKNVVKGSYQVYLTVECTEDTTVTIGIESEKKVKRKQVLFRAPVEGKGSKQRRVNFGGTGRRFRLLIESDTENAWRIAGGMQIIAETDAD